jgi:xanthine permease XanP
MQATETIAGLAEPEEPVRLTMTYDEFDIEVILRYRGPALVLADFPPSRDEIIEPGGDVRLAGYLIKRQAERVQASTENGVSVLQLSFRQ